MLAVTAEKKIIVLNNKFISVLPEINLKNINLAIYPQELGSEPRIIKTNIIKTNIIKILNKIKL
jgi:hypothetical protein